MVTPKKYKDYESAMTRLEEITAQLESGELKLEDAIKLYTDGLEIARFCNEKLNEADAKIKVIVEQSGRVEEEDFSEGEQ
jgi:exodeoxyribonuclease VII small subunit